MLTGKSFQFAPVRVECKMKSCSVLCLYFIFPQRGKCTGWWQFAGENTDILRWNWHWPRRRIHFWKTPRRPLSNVNFRNGTWLCRPSSSFSPRWNIPFVLRIYLTSVWLTAVRWRLGRTCMLLYITFKWISPVLCRQLSWVATVGGFLSVRGSTPAVCHYLEANHKVPYLLRSKTLPEPVGGEGKHIRRSESPQCCDFFFFLLKVKMPPSPD